MNVLTSTGRPTDQRSLPFPVPPSTSDLAQIGLADRLSVRIGIWLLLRTAASLGADHNGRHALRLANERERAAREAAYARHHDAWTIHA